MDDVIELEPGDTPKNLALHEAGECDGLCAICYHEAVEWKIKYSAIGLDTL